MKYFKKSILVSLLLFALVSFLGLSSVQAIEYGGLGIRPHQGDGETRDWFIYASWPGEAIEDKVDITNYSDEPIEVKIYPVDAEILKDGAFAPKAEDAPRVDVGAWTTLTASELSLPPSQAGTVDFSLTIPENTEAGEYIGAIIAQGKESKELEPEEGVTMRVITRVGARVYLTVRGTKVQFLEVKDIELGEELKLQATIWNYEEEEISTRVAFDLFDDQGTLIESWVSSEEVLRPENSRSVQFSKDTAEIGMGDYLVVGRFYRNGEEFKKVENPFRVGLVKFVVSSLAITPDTVLVGEEVAISIDVENIGNIEGTYTATLSINDIVEATKEVIVAAGETKTVSFTISKAEKGIYNVAIGELKGTFTVKTVIPFNVILIGIIIAAVLIVLCVGLLLLRKRFHFRLERK